MSDLKAEAERVSRAVLAVECTDACECRGDTSTDCGKCRDIILSTLRAAEARAWREAADRISTALDSMRVGTSDGSSIVFHQSFRQRAEQIEKGE